MVLTEIINVILPVFLLLGIVFLLLSLFYPMDSLEAKVLLFV